MGATTKSPRSLDPDQRRAVSLRINGTVSAGAGSGKTTVLAARFIDLIATSGADIGSILTLTFTRKAAAEMYSRIHSELAGSAEAGVREALSRFTEASISTIDAFCGAIVRSQAARYGYPPDFSTDDEASRILAEDEALSYLLENRADPALRELTARLGFSAAWKDLFADLAYRRTAPFEDGEVSFAICGERTRTALEKIILEIRDELSEQERIALAAALGITRSGADCDLALIFFRSLAGRPEIPDAQSLRTIAREAGKLKFRAYSRSDPAQLEIKAAAGRIRDEVAQRMESAADLLEDIGLLDTVLRHLDVFAHRYRAAKRSAGIMSFGDVSRCATHLLRTCPGIRAWWKRRFRHIMIDEFQDNNVEQKDLLFLLAEKPEIMSPGIPSARDLVPDKLFFVGDEKQSIYMFRGADVSVFRGLDRELSREEEGAPSGSAARLETNYRSEPALVDFFNSAFARIMADPSHDFEARFAPISSRMPTPGMKPSIRYLVREKPGTGRKDPDERSEDEILAFGIARFVREHVLRGDLEVPDGRGGIRAAGFGDMAILLRSTSNQHLVERFFRLLDIPYSASSVCGLYMESPLNDIYSALRLCLLPEDRTAFAALLRSPIVRVSDDAFIAILGSGARSFDLAGFEDDLLSPADYTRYERGAAIFERITDMKDRISLAELVSWIWNEAGIRAAILSKPDAHPYLEHFEFLFGLACAADAAGRNLSAFLFEDLEPFMGRIEKKDVDDLQRDHSEGVRIMTVHKSKGLEFPIVILPWMNTTGARDDARAAWYASGEVGVSINLKPYDRPGERYRNLFYESAKEIQKARTIAETKRLFYVASTRAICHLVFAGFEPPRAQPEGMSFHSLLVGGDGRRGANGSFAELEDSVEIENLPSLTTEEYRRLFRGKDSRDFGMLEPAYRAASILDRRYGRITFSATELEEARTLITSGRVNEDSIGACAARGWACRGMPFPALPHETGTRSRAGAAGHPDTRPDGATDGATESSPEAGRSEARKDGATFGRLCHAVLEARYKDLEPFALVGGEITRAIPPKRLGLMKTDALALAGRFSESELGRRVAGCAILETEKEFLLRLHGNPLRERLLVSGRMDLLARSGEEIIIVDFKTDREAERGTYELQLWLYRQAARALYPEAKVETWIVWLRGPEAQRLDAEIPGEEIDAAISRLAAMEERGYDRAAWSE